MNDKTLGQRLKDDSETAASDATWVEVKKNINIGDIIVMNERTIEIVGKQYSENPDGTFHIQLNTRDV